MSTMGYLSRSDVTLVGAAVIIIVFAIVITAAVQASNETTTFSKVITVGPVWATDTWICTSTAEFLVHGVLVSYSDGVGLTIFLSGQETQPARRRIRGFRYDSHGIGGRTATSPTCQVSFHCLGQPLNKHVDLRNDNIPRSCTTHGRLPNTPLYDIR